MKLRNIAFLFFFGLISMSIGAAAAYAVAVQGDAPIYFLPACEAV